MAGERDARGCCCASSARRKSRSCRLGAARRCGWKGFCCCCCCCCWARGRRTYAPAAWSVDGRRRSFGARHGDGLAIYSIVANRCALLFQEAREHSVSLSGVLIYLPHVGCCHELCPASVCETQCGGVHTGWGSGSLVTARVQANPRSLKVIVCTTPDHEGRRQNASGH